MTIPNWPFCAQIELYGCTQNLAVTSVLGFQGSYHPLHIFFSQPGMFPYIENYLILFWSDSQVLLICCRMGRDLCYDRWSCDLLLAASSSEVYRLNLEQVCSSFSITSLVVHKTRVL